MTDSCQHRRSMTRARDQDMLKPNDAKRKAGSSRAFSFPDALTEAGGSELDDWSGFDGGGGGGWPCWANIAEEGR